MRRVATILLLCSAAVWTISSIRAAPAAGENESVENLKKEKLKAAEEWWQILVAREQAGAAVTQDEFKVVCALKDAQLDLAAGKPERIRALESYRDRTQVIYDKTVALNKTGRLGGEADHVAEARFHLLEAKTRLKEDEAK